MKKIILWGILIVLIGIQFIRPEKNVGNASSDKDVTHFLAVPADVEDILKTSCYDCHSNNTNYPWYSNINPIGLWLDHHIKEGKGELNFSDFAQYPISKMDHKLEECAEVIEAQEMPLKPYTIMHAGTDLDKVQMAVLINWVNQERAKLVK